MPNNKSIVNDRNWGVKDELGKNHQENYKKRFVSFRYVIVALIIYLFQHQEDARDRIGRAIRNLQSGLNP